MRKRILLAGLLAANLLLAACGGGGSGGGGSSSGGQASCDLKDPPLFEEGALTVATDKPAYPPWFKGNPQSYGGYEGEVANINADRVRRRIGIVYQSFNLFPHMTVLRNITLAPREALKMDRKTAEDHAVSLLERFGLGDRKGEYPDRLSGGQQQRVAIVRALAMRPSIMLLDEVTSALDPELVAEVLSVVRELAQEGMTRLIATHEMGFARDIADRVCFLEEGRILEQGPPERIFSSPENPRTARFLRCIIEAGRL